MRYQMEQLLKQRDAKETELNDLAKMMPQHLWDNDLDRFMEEWNDLIEKDAEAADRVANKTKNKGATARRVQKAIKKKRGDSDDEDDDFSAAAPKRKKASPKKKTQPKKEKEVDDDIEVTSKSTSKPTKKTPAKKHKIESDE